MTEDDDSESAWAFQVECELRQIDDECLYEQLYLNFEEPDNGDYSF